MKRLLAAVGVAGAVVVAAPAAHAGPWDDPSLTPAAQDYVNHHHIAICEALSADLSPRGVARVMHGIETQDHFSYHDTANIMNVSVAKTCPDAMPLLTQVGNSQRAWLKSHSVPAHPPVHVPIPVPNHWRYGGGVLV